LSEDDIRQILDLQFELLTRRLSDRRIAVQLTEEARDLLVKQGFDPAFGARPLKRTIQRLVLDPLAVKVLEGEFKDGDTIRVDRKDDQMVFSAVAAAAEAPAAG
ncbi:MAG: type VI secretion system ATPase TssH, partial [Chloroflexota bacterium]